MIYDETSLFIYGQMTDLAPLYTTVFLKVYPCIFMAIAAVQLSAILQRAINSLNLGTPIQGYGQGVKKL